MIRFCAFEDVERLVRKYSGSMFCLVYPKLQNRKKSLDCIEQVFTDYIDKSPRLKSEKAEQKWLVRRLRKRSGFNRLANTFSGGGLSPMELDFMLTSLRVYHKDEGNKPKKRRSAMITLAVVLILVVIITAGVCVGIKHYKTDGASVQKKLNSIVSAKTFIIKEDGPENQGKAYEYRYCYSVS